MLKIPKVFYADRRSAGVSVDAAITDHARRMLRRVARDLKLRPAAHEIVEEPARSGRGCRVTLRTHSVMLQMVDSPAKRAVAVTFRTRRGHSDLSGGGDNVVSLDQLGTREGYDALLHGLRLAAGLDHERR
jgi:hypothetical protein